MQLKLGNLGGTLYYKDTPILEFKYIRDSLQEARQLCYERKLLPLEFALCGITEESIRNFFDARIVPETRIGIHEALAKTPIQYYEPERIIRYQKGKCQHDDFWLDCDDDDFCWQ